MIQQRVELFYGNQRSAKIVFKKLREFNGSDNCPSERTIGQIIIKIKRPFFTLECHN